MNDDRHQPDPRTTALLGLIIVLVLTILAVLLTGELRREAQREDCLMAQRRNCAPIEVPTSR